MFCMIGVKFCSLAATVISVHKKNHPSLLSRMIIKTMFPELQNYKNEKPVKISTKFAHIKRQPIILE